MKRLHFFLSVMAMAFALCCVSCSKDDDEITPPNGWENARYSSCKIDGLDYIEVPAEGGTFGFRCSENVAVKLTDHFLFDENCLTYTIMDDAPADSTHYKNDWCEATIKGDSLILKFKSNESDCQRKANIGVRYGNEDACFRFVQKTKKGIDSKLVGDWVLDPNVDLGMYSRCGRFGYSFHDDGTCVLMYDSYVRPSTGYTSFDRKYSWSSENINFSFGGWGLPYDCTYELNGDKLTLKIKDGDAEIPFVRLSSSNESAAPMYELSVTPSKSASSEYMLPGEKYTLNCKKIMGGKDYVVDSVCVQRVTCYQQDDAITDTLYIAQNIRHDFAFSKEFEMPANTTSVWFKLNAYFTFKRRDSYGNFVDWSYWNHNEFDIRNKQFYLEYKKK